MVAAVMGRGGRSRQKPLDINTCKNLWTLEGSVPSSLTLRCLLHQVVWKHLGGGWGRSPYRRFALGPTRCLSGAGEGDSSCCGVTETRAMCHKVMAGCDRYPRDPFRNQVSSSLRGARWGSAGTISYLSLHPPVCRLDPGTKLALNQ